MPSTRARRRQRSTRLVTAAALVVIAAVVVLGAILSTSLPAVSVAAVLAVVLGAAAARITHSELVLTRREAAADRARQAQGYRALAEARSAEHREFAGAMQARVGAAEKAVTQLETAVIASQSRAADAMRKMNAEARRADLAEAESGRLAVALEQSEEGAAETIVRVIELEDENLLLHTENDVLKSELHASTWPQLREA